jgi:hypothetical protein
MIFNRKRLINLIFTVKTKEVGSDFSGLTSRFGPNLITLVEIVNHNTDHMFTTSNLLSRTAREINSVMN